MTGSESGDAKVIEALRREGSDLTKPHYVDFFFLVPGESEAHALAAALQQLGMKVEVAPPCDAGAGWSCTGWQWHLLEVARMEALTSRLQVLARGFRGEYDGWGTEIVC